MATVFIDATTLISLAKAGLSAYYSDEGFENLGEAQPLKSAVTYKYLDGLLATETSLGNSVVITASITCSRSPATGARPRVLWEHPRCVVGATMSQLKSVTLTKRGVEISV